MYCKPTRLVSYHIDTYRIHLDQLLFLYTIINILILGSKIECDENCKISVTCKEFVISIETGQYSFYSSYTVMYESVQNVILFRVYIMK